MMGSACYAIFRSHMSVKANFRSNMSAKAKRGPYGGKAREADKMRV